MERDIALRIDGMIRSINGTLDNLAGYIRKSCTREEARILIHHVGKAMGASFELGEAIWSQHPDICPPELKPEKKPKQSKRAATKRTRKR